ncbi:unnamed protein product [Symbiodinium natans]|uniref:EF-hand domain-containing protein n=1 Tax=Symbiodinium natans TaxID=878477 RepID=A0A812LTX7_9DINO|nr:unnamed protein product [Symbiodinium natans]
MAPKRTGIRLDPWKQFNLPQSMLFPKAAEKQALQCAACSGRASAGAGDGFMTFDDLSHGLADAGLSDLSEHRTRRLFSELDGDVKGRVSLRQFAKCLSTAAASAPSRVGSPLAARNLRRSPSPPMPSTRTAKGTSGRLVRSPSPPSPRLARAQKPSFELTYQAPSARPSFSGPA